MADRFVGYGEFACVVADHFRPYLHGDEFFTVVNADFCAHHFRQYNQVSDMGFDVDVFALFLGFFGFSEFL